MRIFEQTGDSLGAAQEAARLNPDQCPDHAMIMLHAIATEAWEPTAEDEVHIAAIRDTFLGAASLKVLTLS